MRISEKVETPGATGRSGAEPVRRIAIAMLFALGIVSGDAQTFLFHQSAMVWSTNKFGTNFQRGVNYSSFRGVPIFNTASGADGRAPAGQFSTTNQFQGLLSHGAVASPTNSAALHADEDFSRNAKVIGHPVGERDGQVVYILRSAQVAAPTFSRPVEFLFGDVIPPPDKDENGDLIVGMSPEDYWFAEPHSVPAAGKAKHEGEAYYWSPHAQSVFATQPGPVEITWRKKEPVPYDTNSPPAGVEGVDWIRESGFAYQLKNSRYVVSGSPTKTPKSIYWTEGPFRGIGKPINVPNARVSAVNIVYSDAFDSTVSEAERYVAVGENSPADGSTNSVLRELRTLWYDSLQGQIFAYNKTGRVFVELLGDTVGAGQRQFLGFEIVNVYRTVTPATIRADLGDKITPNSDGTSDPDLTPSPVQTELTTQPFLYAQPVVGSERTDYYAAKETSNLNDVLVHWLESGVEGLRWPKRFTRYQLGWPSDPKKYSHYVRTLAASESEAAETAVHLPGENVPTIQYQDPLDRPRAKLTEDNGFYTHLDVDHPAHRTLLRFQSGDRVAFERVFSWLDDGLKVSQGFASSVVTNLAGWGIAPPEISVTEVFDLPKLADAIQHSGESFSDTEFAKYLKDQLAPQTALALNTFFSGDQSGQDTLRSQLVSDLDRISRNPAKIWTERHTPNRTLKKLWSIAASADGSHLIYANDPGSVYTSVDFGTNWTQRNPDSFAVQKAWQAVASSADGSTLMAADNNRIFTSSDSGRNWTFAGPSKNWSDLAMSADGDRMAAVSANSEIYVSYDQGANWVARENSRNWSAIASSASGDRLIAATSGGRIYISTDAGTNWVAREQDRSWSSVASSADGLSLAATVNNGFIYLSKDGGTNWIARGDVNSWSSIASSADGSVLVAAGDKAYSSADGGTTWFAEPGSSVFNSVASSADGERFAGVSDTTAFTATLYNGFGDDVSSRRQFIAENLPGIQYPQSIFDATSPNTPRVIQATKDVGDRIEPPENERGDLAGYILQNKGDAFNNAGAYRNPFVSGIESAKLGAIIPVNARPGNDKLDVWWFRANATNEVRNLVNGFQPVYWPSVIGRYTLQWPDTPDEIVLASNDGSGGLMSLEATGSIYTQNDASLPGYNPNEEHALMLGGQAYALRDDLNVTTGAGYSSEPFVLLDYVASDGRPMMRAFKVLREKPAAGLVFDYVVEAGTSLQPPAPLSLLPAPLETVTNILNAGTANEEMEFFTRNHNTEPLESLGDLPIGWGSLSESEQGRRANYRKFTYKDRKDAFWVMRGLHSGLPALAAGSYEGGGFVTSLSAVGVVGQAFTNVFHVSRRTDSLVMTLTNGTLPPGLSIDGVRLLGIPTVASGGVQLLTFEITDTSDQATVSVDLSLEIASSGNVDAQSPLTLVSTNQYAGNNATFVGRAPFLAVPADPTNSFTMRFYYLSQEGFAWPGIANPPAVGSIVPYLTRADAEDRHSKTTPSLDIVYRPVWPSAPPTMQFGQTLLGPSAGLPAVRGQTSLELLYQQSIALDITSATNESVVLHDPTSAKSFVFNTNGLAKIPAGVLTENYQGKTYFPNLPPHLAKRFFFDPNVGALGSLVFLGEFVDEVLGADYLLLNVLRGSDLTAVLDLCPVSDADKSDWDAAVNGLSAKVVTKYENPLVPGQWIDNPDLTRQVTVGDLIEVTQSETAIDSYALSASGPGQGYVTFIVGDSGNPDQTPAGDPVSMYVLRVEGSLYPGELKIIPNENPLSEFSSFQHSPDLAGRFDEYEYEWKMAPPVDGDPPVVDPTMSAYQPLVMGPDLPRYILGGSSIRTLVDNYIVLRYRPINPDHPLHNQWSEWTTPQMAEGWIKRVLAGINPFNQRVTDLYNNAVNTDANILTSAGARYEGDIALNLDSINDYGLIEIYETVLKRGRGLSIDSGINFGPANDALLLAAGYINDLYMLVGNEAFADAANPTIGIGTKDSTYGDIATSLFAFKGQLPSVLAEELALLRGRDDVFQPGVETAPVYNRLVWNFTRGIDSGEVIYALNYNILDQDNDGAVGAGDAAHLYPQGHGDAYGHYLTANKGYYSLLMNNHFDWVPRVEAVTILGKPVSVDYVDERKFATAAAALARTGRQIFDLTWRQDYQPGDDRGWEHLSTNRVSRRESVQGSTTNNIVREWGADQWASRTMQGTFFNWVVGNAILPAVDPDPTHEGIQKIDRTTVPELQELVTTAIGLQTASDNAEGRLNPLGLAEGSLAFDINPDQVVGGDGQTHFEQVFARAKTALNNAVASFDDAKDVTRLLRSEQDSLADFQTDVAAQEHAYTSALIELYGTPYTDDIGTGKTYAQGYSGPDLLHYTYVEIPEREFGANFSFEAKTFQIDVQTLPSDWTSTTYTNFSFYQTNGATDYVTNTVSYPIGDNGLFTKPAAWTGRRVSPGKIQDAISRRIAAQNKLRTGLEAAASAKSDLDKALNVFGNERKRLQSLNFLEDRIVNQLEIVEAKNASILTEDRQFQAAFDILATANEAITETMPKSLLVGLASGGDFTSVARGLAYATLATAQIELNVAAALEFSGTINAIISAQEEVSELTKAVSDVELDAEIKAAVLALGDELSSYQAFLVAINERARDFSDADRAYRALVAKGDRLQAERESFRQRSASVIQGFRTRDAAFRIFRNEKLERYKTLFDLAARYSYLAASAYDYETGLLNTDAGRAFVNRIVSARALGLVQDGEPQFGGSNNGDPGLSSVLAEMKADWDVLKGRLGFNNPDAYGTTVSLRQEAWRFLAGAEGSVNWQDKLLASSRENLLADSDVRQHCLQIAGADGLPVPGLIIEFSTSIEDGHNLFGQTLAGGDHKFSPSSFATKIFAAGVAFEGYQGMDDPAANNGATGGNSATEPETDFLNQNNLSATPYVYLIPVGVDSMRSPPLGDTSEIRSWTVNDVAIPLPFNVGASDFSSKALYQSADSLTEPLFATRKHQAFRPVSSASVFSTDLYGSGGSLNRSQFTNNRLIGRSVWNSRWKLVIPGRELLGDPDEGIERFIRTVNDIKLHFVTYSYSGN